MSDLVQELTRRVSSRERVLAALQQAGGTGVTNVELNAIAFRFGGRLFELAKAGHNIQKEHLGGGVWRYTLRPQDRLF